MTESAGIRAYTRGAMLLHWAIAVVVALQLVGGYAMSRTDLFPDMVRFAAFQWHKTLGVAVIALTLARIAWRLMNSPPSNPALSRAERRASSAVHAALYGLMIAVPLSGWALVSSSATAVPTLLAMTEALAWPHLPSGAATSAGGGAHAVLAYGFAALLAAHVAAALKHSMADRMPSLARIVPTRRLRATVAAPNSSAIALGAGAAFLAAGLWFGSQEAGSTASGPAGTASEGAYADAGEWRIDKAASSINLTLEFSGRRIEGVAEAWEASVDFDPTRLNESSAEVVLRADGISVDDAFIAPNVGSADGVDASTHPTVRIRLDTFEAADGGYLGLGTIEVKGRSVPIRLPFSFEEAANGNARVRGEATLDRFTLGLGASGDPEAKWLGRTVTVMIDLTARR